MRVWIWENMGVCDWNQCLSELFIVSRTKNVYPNDLACRTTPSPVFQSLKKESHGIYIRLIIMSCLEKFSTRKSITLPSTSRYSCYRHELLNWTSTLAENNLQWNCIAPPLISVFCEKTFFCFLIGKVYTDLKNAWRAQGIGSRKLQIGD